MGLICGLEAREMRLRCYSNGIIDSRIDKKGGDIYGGC